MQVKQLPVGRAKGYEGTGIGLAPNSQGSDRK